MRGAAVLATRVCILWGEAAFMSKDLTGPDALHQRIAELERFCGQLALENQFLKKGLASARSQRDTP